MGDADWLKELVREIPDFPRPGVSFKDLTPLLADVKAFRFGIEARGFIVAAPVAYRLGVSFVPVRKAGKLPWKVEKEEYILEYGTDLLEIHLDALSPGDRVLIVDDVMATGGTAVATAALVERLGATVAGMGFIVELSFLGGHGKLAGYDAVSLISYE